MIYFQMLWQFFPAWNNILNADVYFWTCRAAEIPSRSSLSVFLQLCMFASEDLEVGLLLTVICALLFDGGRAVWF